MSLAHYYFSAKYRQVYKNRVEKAIKKSVLWVACLSTVLIFKETTAACCDCLPFNSFAQLRVSKSFQVLVKISSEIWGISTKGEVKEGNVTCTRAWEDFGRVSSQSRITDDFSCGTNSQKYLPAEENKMTDFQLFFSLVLMYNLSIFFISDCHRTKSCASELSNEVLITPIYIFPRYIFFCLPKT